MLPTVKRFAVNYAAITAAAVLCFIMFVLLASRCHISREIRTIPLPRREVDKNKLEPRIQVYMARQPDHDGYLLVNLTTRRGKTPISIFFLEDDAYISAGILRNGRWEGETFDAMQNLFEQNPDWNFLDIGCHVGNFALMAAKWGRRVLAVDSSFESISRLRRSCDLGQFPANQITTVWNAVGDEYKTVATKKYARNYAAGYIVDLEKDTDHEEVQEPVPMIHLDDLLEVTTFKTAIMKLDIEGYEGKALKYADELFKKIKIPFVFMKWHILMKNEPAAQAVMAFFRSHGYRPATIGDYKTLTAPHREWPRRYCWVKQSL